MLQYEEKVTVYHPCHPTSPTQTPACSLLHPSLHQVLHLLSVRWGLSSKVRLEPFGGVHAPYWNLLMRSSLAHCSRVLANMCLASVPMLNLDSQGLCINPSVCLLARQKFSLSAHFIESNGTENTSRYWGFIGDCLCLRALTVILTIFICIAEGILCWGWGALGWGGGGNRVYDNKQWDCSHWISTVASLLGLLLTSFLCGV